METAMLEGLREQARKGKRADTGFKKEAWTAVLPIITEAMPPNPDGIYLQMSQEKASAKLSDLKEQYTIYMKLEVELSGFGWDEARQMVTAPDEVWDVYLLVR